MREHAIQNHRNATLLGIGAKLLEVLIGAEQRIHIPIICRIIPMVFVGLKNRIQIDTGDTQILQIIQLAADALQVAAEVVVVPNVTICIRLIIGQSIPVIPQHTVCRHIFMHLAAFAESIRENLIHNTALEEIGCFKRLSIDSQLKEIAVFQGAVMAISSLDVAAYAMRSKCKIVIMHAGKSRGKGNLVEVSVRTFLHTVHSEKPFPKARSEQHQNRQIIQRNILRHKNRKNTFRTTGNCTEWLLIGFIPTIINGLHETCSFQNKIR